MREVAKTQCKLCNQWIANCSIKQHLRSHANGNFDTAQKRLDRSQNLVCSYCGNVFKNLNSLTQHEIRCKENPNYTNTIQHLCRGRCLDEDKEAQRRSKLSVVAKSKGLGGYVKGSGRGRKGYYKGIWCDSGWELAYVMYNLDHGIEFKRNTDSFPYVYQGRQLNYVPDFYEAGYYIEIKGREWYIDAYKYPSVPNLKILRQEEMKTYLEYAVTTYGEHFASDNLT